VLVHGVCIEGRSNRGPTTQLEGASARRERLTALTGRAHGTERVLGRVGEGNRHRQTGPTGQREGKRARTRAIADRWDPPVRRRGRARGLARLSWAKLAEMRFSIFSEFLIAFLFILSMDFKSNSNSNNIKHVHQHKRKFRLSMMQHFMTQIGFDKIIN
jgi:hypothetical protein